MLKSKGLVSKAINETIVFKTGNVFKNGISVIGTIKENVSLMPVMQMLKSIFALPNILKDVLNNMNELERSKSILNFVNGTRWKKIKENYNTGDIIIPFDYYIDDFETGNALGSNAGTHKITAHYISFPTFPQHLLSSTKYVFEVLLSPATLQHNEMQYCLEPLINIFKELEEEGIELEIDGENKTVFFVMGRVIGDNLALNEILGFSKSFNANRFCRMCDAQKQQTQAISISSESDLRSKEQYEVALSMNDAKETGVYETCYFNELKNFHCTENICCDILHDVFEGLAKYDLALCLKAIIDDKNLPTITLDKINIFKQNFNYGKTEIGNLSKPIQENHLKSGFLKMSASESRTFLRLLPLIMGSMIPKNNKYWMLILELVDLGDLIMYGQFDENILEKLRQKIKSYNTQFIKLFGKNLRPKNHLVSHYVECINHNGPLRTMMTFVYESKNREVKSYAKVTNQRINIAQSLGFKASMRFNNFLLEHADGFPITTTHEKSEIVSIDMIKNEQWFKQNNIHQKLTSVTKDNKLEVCKKIKHKGSSYENDTFIIDNQCSVQKCMKIIKIFTRNEKYLILTELFQIIEYKNHYRSYEIGSSTDIFEIIDVNNIYSLPHDIHRISNGQYYLKIKYI